MVLHAQIVLFAHDHARGNGECTLRLHMVRVHDDGHWLGACSRDLLPELDSCQPVRAASIKQRSRELVH